jgi:hypothetical protein
MTEDNHTVGIYTTFHVSPVMQTKKTLFASAFSHFFWFIFPALLVLDGWRPFGELGSH